MKNRLWTSLGSYSRAASAASLLLVAMLCAYAPGAKAALQGDEKNLRGRLGLGFTNQIAEDSTRTIPALDAKFYMNKSTAFGIGCGFNTISGDNAVALGMKGYKNVFVESNLVFYVGMGLAYISHNGSKYQGSAFIGSEFFFERIPSLGFSFEAGLRGDNTAGTFAIRTTGDSFLTAGMHFYL
jgi:hypothetical protein